MNTPLRTVFATSALLLLAGCSSSEPTEAPIAKPNSGTVSMPGFDVSYTASGDSGPTIVLVHGAACNSSIWKAQLDTLDDEHRVIAIDLPGHGESSAPDVDYPASVFADSVLAVMDADDTESATLVGHSFGVSVVRDVLKKQPSRVEGLVMLDGFLVPLAPPALGGALLASFDKDFEGAADTFIDSFMFADSTPDSVKTQVRTMMLETSPHVWRAVLTLALSSDIEDDEQNLLPVQGLYTQNGYVPADYDHYLAERFPSVDYQTVPVGTGHFLMLERPDDVNAAITSIVQR